ncbi:PIR Superfamily Protein [Plasmodium ovale curtisi]|uniref:PIR Superfamily Protein n=1 Tax=Plasmodium ovale curtisi TaxID=864141 RepID=A0A1A8XE15_PLAOA|nr:PIR Superfamily Protein [Plasmodium ovale curtisi]
MGHEEEEDFYCSYTEFKNYNDISKSFRTTEIDRYTKSCSDDIKKEFSENTDIKDIFTKLKKILEHYKNPNPQNSNKYYGYINYWLKNELTENDLFNKNTTDFCNKFKNCDSEIELLNKRISDINSKDNNLFERINELYNVYYDYFNFKSFESSMSLESFESIKCVYAERCVSKYNDFVDKYASNNKSNLLNELLNLEQLFNQDRISSLQGCDKHNIPKLKSLPSANKSEVISSSLSSSSLVPIPVIAATVGIFPLLLLLYKHTPLVSLLYNRIIWMKNKLINVAQENHELSFFDERNKAFSDNESYNLIYSSADYS